MPQTSGVVYDDSAIYRSAKQHTRQQSSAASVGGGWVKRPQPSSAHEAQAQRSGNDHYTRPHQHPRSTGSPHGYQSFSFAESSAQNTGYASSAGEGNVRTSVSGIIQRVLRRSGAAVSAAGASDSDRLAGLAVSEPPARNVNVNVNTRHLSGNASNPYSGLYSSQKRYYTSVPGLRNTNSIY
jgi:hypothetical protein